MRVNVYVGEDLKKRMDKVKEPVNWSRVACQAFEIHLGEIAARKKDKTMEDVIQRLRASKAKGETADEKAGRAAGVAWAKRGAEWSDLRAIAHFEREINERGHGFADDIDESDPGASYIHQTFGAGTMGLHEAHEWWRNQIENPSPTVDFVYGFHQGALEVFEHVNSKVDLV